MLNLNTITITAAAILALAACKPDTQRQGEQVQEDVMSRAMQNVPVPQTNNFLTRVTNSTPNI